MTAVAVDTYAPERVRLGGREFWSVMLNAGEGGALS